jgi:hypothetical protein
LIPTAAINRSKTSTITKLAMVKKREDCLLELIEFVYCQL